MIMVIRRKIGGGTAFEEKWGRFYLFFFGLPLSSLILLTLNIFSIRLIKPAHHGIRLLRYRYGQFLA